MTKKGIAFIVLAAFLISSLYLCPCAVAMGSDVNHVPDSGRCCDRMPNCPQKDENPKGIKSLISVFSGKTPRNPILQLFSSDVWKLHGNMHQGLLIERRSLFPADFIVESHSPPKLFIKHSSLLI